MSFLTPILLAGAAAFLVPLIIHLLNRRRMVRVQWGAMHLLHEVIRQKRSRLRIEQWLLLMTRIAIPIVLALCLARPVLKAIQSLPGFNKTSMVVLLDDSFSMRAPAESGAAAFDQAREDLRRLLDALPAGSDAQLIRAGGDPRAATSGPVTDLDTLSAALPEWTANEGPVSPQNLIQEAMAAAAQAGTASREIAMLSDFQKSDWAAVLAGGGLPALENPGAGAVERPLLTLFQVPTQATENLVISAAELSTSLAAAGQPVALKLRLLNHGERPWQDIPVHLEADGQRLRTSRVSVPVRGEATLFFTHAFDTVGDHVLTARLEGDSFPDDNARHVVVQVRDQLSVVLIEGNPGSGPLAGSLDFFNLALTPHFGAGAPALKDLIVTRTVDARRLKESELAGARVVVLGGLQRGNPGLLQMLGRFVENGGGLLLLAPEDAQPAQWQRELGKAADWLPAVVAGQAHVENRDFPARLQSARYTHPALSYFNDPRAGRLAEAEINHWWVLEPLGDEARVIASLDRGAPLLVERRHGRGVVIQSAIPLRPGWSNVPLRPWFVPLAQRLAAWLAVQDTDSSSHLVGERPAVVLDEGYATLAHALKDPAGQSTTVEPEDGVLRLPPLSMPGVHELAPVDESAPGKARKLAVNVDPAESDLTVLSGEELRELAGRLDAEAVTSVEEYQRLDRSRRFGTEVWMPLLALLVGLLFFEVLLQQRISAPR